MQTLESTITQPDEAIVHPLEQLRGAIRRYVLWDALLSAGLFVVVWYWLGMALDYGLYRISGFDWVLDAPRWLRVVTFAALALVFITILVTRLFLRLSRTMSYSSLALLLEKRFPTQLGDRLITAIEMSDVPKMVQLGYSESMLRQTIDDARDRVKSLPVDDIFNWSRLRIKGVLLALFALGILLMVAVGYYAATGSISMKRFSRDFGNISTVWGERNIALLNTPWNRNSHLELIGFPESGELRIGKDAAAPTIRVRAYRWVIADRDTEFGWRPLLWSDLSERLLGFKPSSSVAKGEIDLDRLEAAATKDDGVEQVLKKLELIVSANRQTRTIRKLQLPEAVTLTYAGENTRGKVNFSQEGLNEFTAEVSGLKESVRFQVRALDFVSQTRRITLVPPPLFSKLTRQEYQPAYLFHPPPLRENVPENAPRYDFKDLAAQRQFVGDKDLSLTGEKSVASILKGTEFELVGIADKPLSAVVVKPKIGPLPKSLESLSPAMTLTPTGENRDTFRLSFRGDDKPMATTEFDLNLIDDDNVVTTRTILIQVTEDQAPQVELAVDVLRKVGNQYLVTPIARVPFLTESKGKDDYGLSKLEFQFQYSAVDTQVVVEIQANALAGIFASLPLQPSFATALTPLASATFTQALLSNKSATTTTGKIPVERFQEEFNRLTTATMSNFQAKLKTPSSTETAQVIRETRLTNQDLDTFNLQQAMPGLLENDPSKNQPRYKIEVNMLATDTNVESGPKTGQNLEPVRLLVISEAELLAEMSKDEEALATKLDEVLKRLRTAQANLDQVTQRVSGPTPNKETIQSAAVRALDIAQDLAKARDQSNSILTDYRRLERETRFNQLREETLKAYRDKITLLEQICEKAFADTEQAHSAVQTALAEDRAPDAATFETDRREFAELIRLVATLRDKLGEAISLNAIRNTLEMIRKNQASLGVTLQLLQKTITEQLYLPELRIIPAVELKQNEKRTVKLPIDWKAFVGDGLTVKLLSADGSIVSVPGEIKVGDDQDSLSVELVAGAKVGTTKITLTPNVGKVVEVEVKVK